MLGYTVTYIVLLQPGKTGTLGVLNKILRCTGTVILKNRECCGESDTNLIPKHVEKGASPGPRHQFMFRNYDSFYGEELLAPRPTPKLEDHTLLVVHGCLFNIFAATLHTGGRPSIRNLKTRHFVVTGTHFG